MIPSAPPALPTINHLLAWHWHHGSPDDVLFSVEVEHVDGQSTPDMDDVKYTRRASRPSQRQYQDITYREGLTAALLVADHLRQQRCIAKGSTVAIVSPNSPSMLVVSASAATSCVESTLTCPPAAGHDGSMASGQRHRPASLRRPR